MSELPTVLIRKANKWGYAIINRADFDEARHELYVDSEDEPAASSEIPADWQSLHWKKQVALAKHLTGQEAGNAADAVALIQGHIDAANAAAPEA